MNSLALKRIARGRAVKPIESEMVIGTLQAITAAGEVYVDYPGNERGPLLARVLISTGASSAPNWQPGDAVVLLLGVAATAGPPVILGTAAERMPVGATPRSVNSRERDALVDGRRVVLEAQSEIVLRCGKSSITLTSDGKVVIKGTELVSRSSGVNKIRGALVNIN